MTATRPEYLLLRLRPILCRCVIPCSSDLIMRGRWGRVKLLPLNAQSLDGQCALFVPLMAKKVQFSRIACAIGANTGESNQFNSGLSPVERKACTGIPARR